MSWRQSRKKNPTESRTISIALNRWFMSWVKRRVPAASKIQLAQNNIFILPSKYGAFFILVMMAVFLSGVNYSNSLMLLLAFFLISLFLVSISYTYRNLSGLHLSVANTEGCFVGEQAMFKVMVSRNELRCYENIRLSIVDTAVEVVNLIDEQEQVVEIMVDAEKRGRLNPGRIKVETLFPLGLFRAWSWVDLKMFALIFPKPIENYSQILDQGSGQNSPIANPNGSEDFFGLKRYTPGDSISHCCWKSLSRGQPLTTKEFVNPVDETFVLKLDAMKTAHLEEKLNYLCYWIIKCAEQNHYFALELGSSRLDVGRGPDHMKEALSRLALFSIGQ